MANLCLNLSALSAVALLVLCEVSETVRTKPGTAENPPSSLASNEVQEQVGNPLVTFYLASLGGENEEKRLYSGGQFYRACDVSDVNQKRITYRPVVEENTDGSRCDASVYAEIQPIFPILVRKNAEALSWAGAPKEAPVLERRNAEPLSKIEFESPQQEVVDDEEGCVIEFEEAAEANGFWEALKGLAQAVSMALAHMNK